MKNIMAAVLLLLVFGFLASGSAGQEICEGAAGIKTLSLKVDGLTRTYTVFEPSRYSRQQPVPLVIVLHGAGGVGQGIIQETAWDRKAESENFLVVFPDAMRPNPQSEPSFLVNPQVWNDGADRGQEFLRDVNDVKFLSLMLGDLRQKYAIDWNAVYLAGFSNGASMGFKAALELPGKFAALAAVSGSFWPRAGFAELQKSIPTIFIAGTADPFNPVDGGSIRLPWGTFEQPSLMTTIDKWARLNGIHKGLRPIAGRSGVRVYEGMGNKHSVMRAYLVEGLGHMWPGGEAIFPEEYIGKDPRVVNATDLIWDFFAEVREREIKGGV